VPRGRLGISPKDKDLPARFALRLRELMERRGWNSRDVADLVTREGVPVMDRAVDAWLAGRRLPKLKDLERIGTALGLADYRDLLPAPIKTPK
jgi:hypothetical protein